MFISTKRAQQSTFQLYSHDLIVVMSEQDTKLYFKKGICLKYIVFFVNYCLNNKVNNLNHIRRKFDVKEKK